MDWISDEIAIGNYLDAKGHGPDFDAIVCLKPDCCDENRTEEDILCLPLIDGSGNRSGDIITANRVIKYVANAGEKILVHCHAGRSRSAALVARYLMDTYELNRNAAISFIAAKGAILLSDGIKDILNKMFKFR